ncbi:MAG: hypothetical protein AAGA18_15600, partial [Verrucomicrobiota bacterium]
ALPIGYYLMKSWFESFSYRIGLEPIYFILAGALILALAWLTIISQTARSANMKVTESLKGE